MRYWLNRLAESVPLLIGISLLAFAIFRLSPGDPVALLVDPTLLSAEEREAVRDQLGLNDALPVQYAKMMRGLVTGDLRSFKSKQPTLTVVRQAFPTTALVGGLGLAIAVVLALILGILAGRRPGGSIDRVVSTSMVTSLALPPFLISLLLVRLLTEEWDLLPGSGIAPPGTVGFHPQPKYLVMPIMVVAFGITPILARYLRDSMVQVLGDDYVRTARAKGLRESAVMTRHAVRNALIPVISLLNTFIPVTLGGSVIIETVFGLPGLGRVTTSAALARDYPVVLTAVVFVAVLTVATNLVIDAIYGLIDPRIRIQ
ncbi:MAG: peptide/nickel transport system permease protein [Thermomicrobiales bacterium]|jgi:peptide/nickel transport system permease protein|nr:peptide/nickel transport system permease protein [Thermomicrobiales bacterium]MEA2525489.1 peptide/nickel transport system permease protein [Thermomicrobiales bacterium]MEA2531527.1 peptide/nickel transport system permease protein [Thermomicrobiales bacterium]MEA2586344.1 peptide/nickel transport system permease protein [Thermomicrobiales bacterium]